MNHSQTLLAGSLLAAMLSAGPALAQTSTPAPVGSGGNLAPDPAGRAGTEGTTSTSTTGSPGPSAGTTGATTGDSSTGSMSGTPSSTPSGRAGGSASGSGIGMGGGGMGSGGMGASGTGSVYGSGQGWSVIPYTTGGYVGLNIGRPNYDTPCGTGTTCDDPNASFKIYTGGMVNPYFGLELGYLHLGNADRAGGDTRAQGINLSLVGRAPVSQSLSLFAKVGATYGRTEITSSPASGVTGGKDDGWGASYGVGASWEINRNWAAVLEWERHDFHFANLGREPVKSTSLGVIYRF